MQVESITSTIISTFNLQKLKRLTQNLIRNSTVQTRHLLIKVAMKGVLLPAY